MTLPGHVCARTRVWCYLIGAGLILFALYLFFVWQVYRFSAQTSQGEADVIVVMGAAVSAGKPSLVFQRRINHAILLYKTHAAGKIIFTGGKNQTGEIAESEAARRYALQNGIPAADIYTESVSANSYENLQQARTIMRQQGFMDVLIVSDPAHMKRVMSMAGILSLRAYSSPHSASRFENVFSPPALLLKEGLKYPLALFWYSVMPERM